MPTIVDAHVHLGTTRETLLTDLRRRAYLSVSAAFSTGSDAAGSLAHLSHTSRFWPTKPGRAIAS